MKRLKPSIEIAVINEGRIAFKDGEEVQSCPYKNPLSQRRWAWVWGFQEAERERKINKKTEGEG